MFNMRPLPPKIFSILLIWPGAMVITALIIGSFVSAGMGNPMGESITISLVNTLTISFWPVFGGFVIMLLIPPHRKYLRPVAFFAGILALTLWGDYLARSIIHHLVEPATMDQIRSILKIQWIPSLMIAILTGIPFYNMFSGYGVVVQPEENSPEESLEISIRRRLIKFPLADLVYLEAKGRRTLVYTNEAEHLSSTPLRVFTDLLREKGFLRVHKSFLVNPLYIDCMEKSPGGGRILHLKDQEDSSLPIGRVYEKELRGRIRERA